MLQMLHVQAPTPLRLTKWPAQHSPFFHGLRGFVTLWIRNLNLWALRREQRPPRRFILCRASGSEQIF
ncbi:hypothetical protein QC764_0001720 [Podospora pseudoanserina]|uniref:Uncharacterized protein n=1 Tax=Podospora pseudoanserina TaxID=2609844 RepID=A0ABR0IKK4_9PEZI|nr:hypothetical protein QC764_0001720 [Podospora pseudoanserina]